VIALPLLGLQGQSVDALLKRGDEAYTGLKTLEALGHFEQAERSAPADYRVLMRLARGWCDMGRLTLRRSDSSETYYRRSVAYAERMVQLHPDSANSWFLLALCHGSLAPFKTLTEKLNIARDVEKNALKALSMDPTYGLVHVLLGIYYREASRLSWVERTIANSILGKDIVGTLEASEEQFRKALAIDEKNSFAWFEMSVTLRRMERTSEAIAALERCVSLPATNEREVQQRDQARSMLERLRTPAAE
jgi:tetratricopeptide (TPR) repeat protein